MSKRRARSLFAFPAALLMAILGVTTVLAATTWMVRPGGNLHFYNVRGCAALINTGDSATISATYTMSPMQTITSS